MKILYVHQYFNTPREAGGTRSYWISQKLLEKGHEVTMITTARKKDAQKYMDVDGISVIYLRIPYSNHMGILRRFQSFFSFMLYSTWIILKGPKYDTIIATSTPLTVGFPALIAKFFRRIPYVFEVRDLWPEVPIQMGGLKNPLLIWLAKTFEKTIYRYASQIVALSPGMYEGVIAAGASADKAHMIPNMSKIDAFWPRPVNIDVLNALDIDNKSFKVVYFGAMGIANGMDYILDAAKLLIEYSQIQVILIGDGSTLPDLQERCINEEIANVKFVKALSMKDLSRVVNACQVSLVTFSDLPILATNSPNKFFDSLSAGKPILVNSPGWTKKIVEEYDCGMYSNPKKPEELAENIITLYKNPKKVREKGLNARKLAETTYDKSILCEKFSEVIKKVERSLG